MKPSPLSVDTIALLIGLLLAPMTIGCDQNENNRLAEMAERCAERQAEQTRQMTELQHELLEGSRNLVDADAQSRQEMVDLVHDVQDERAKVDQQRDRLEGERRDLATQRQRAPIIAAAITNAALILACVLPLVVCWHLLARPIDPTDDQLVAEFLLEDLVADRPLLPLPDKRVRAIGVTDENESKLLTNASESADDSH